MQIGNATASALNGMRAQVQRLEQSAQNVANVDTPGYVGGRSDSVSLGSAGSGVGGAGGATYTAFGASSGSTPGSAESAGAGGESNTDLATESVSQLGSLRAFQANVAVFRTADAMTGELLNQKA